MAGQPVKRGNWGDWAVIERKPFQGALTCGDCVHFDPTDNTCTVRPIHAYDVGRFYWRRCPDYRSGFASSTPPNTSNTYRKQTNISKPVFDKKINIGDYVTDFNKNIGKVVAIDRINHTVDVQFPLRLAKFSYPYVFVSGKLRFYAPAVKASSSKESVPNPPLPSSFSKSPQTQLPQPIKADSQITTTDTSSKTIAHTSSSPSIHKGTQNAISDSPVSIQRTIARAKQKKADNLIIADFCIGMELIHRNKMLGTGHIFTIDWKNKIIHVVFPGGKKRQYSVPQDFIAGIVRIK